MLLAKLATSGDGAEAMGIQKAHSGIPLKKGDHDQTSQDKTTLTEQSNCRALKLPYFCMN
jgi:hypothetical protein